MNSISDPSLALSAPEPLPARESYPRQVARRGQTDQKIRKAVLAIVRRQGLTSVTIDAVAAESGVAKTTIYRRYDDRFALMSGVARQLSHTVVNDHSHTKEGLCGLIRDLQQDFEGGLGLTAIATLLTSTDPYIPAWRGSVLTPVLELVREYFTTGIDQGVFAASIDYKLLIETIIGGMVFCAALRGEVPDDWANRATEMVWQYVQPEW